MGILIEHTAGAFPVWLAPIQARVIPIADRHLPYAQQVMEQLRERGIRVDLADERERMNAKIRNAQLQKIPYMLVVGDREMEEHAASVRLRSNENLGLMSLEKVVERIVGIVRERSREL